MAQAEAKLAAVKLPDIPPGGKLPGRSANRPAKKPLGSKPSGDAVGFIAALLLYAPAALNAMNLMLVRLLRRRQELGIRLVCTRWRVIRLLMLEGAGLAALAGLTVLSVGSLGVSADLRRIHQREALRFVSYWNGPITGSIAVLSTLAGLALVLVSLCSVRHATSAPQLKEGTQVRWAARAISTLALAAGDVADGARRDPAGRHRTDGENIREDPPCGPGL